MNSRNHFSGQHVLDFLHTLAAAIVSGQNIASVAEPGYGKTSMAIAGARHVVGEGNFSFDQLAQSSDPIVIEGTPSPVRLLDPENPTYELMQDGTPSDQSLKISILDEIFRTNDAVLDILLTLLENRMGDPREAKTFVATSNWVNENERTRALRSRFALYFHFRAELDFESVIQTVWGTIAEGAVPGLSDEQKAVLPGSWEEVMAVRSLVPNGDTERVVERFLATIVEDATAENFPIPPRLVTQWARIAYYHSAFHHGAADFDEIPDATKRVFRFAYPTVNAAEHLRWTQMIGQSADQDAAVVNALMTDLVEAFNRVLDEASPLGVARTLVKLTDIAADKLDEVLDLLDGDDSHPEYTRAQDFATAAINEATKADGEPSLKGLAARLTGG